MNSEGRFLTAGAGRRRSYDGVLPTALKWQLETLLSPPQCHAFLSMIPHTLALMDQPKGVIV